MKADATLGLFPGDGAETGLPSISLERTCWKSGYASVAGVDEAGRGCLSGPVVAAAVIFPIECRIEGVADSKRLKPASRDRLADVIREQALAVATGMCSPAEIDEMNILQASLEAMRRAVNALALPPDFVLIDGNAAFKNADVPIKTVIKGDARSHTIAAASIIAKTTRDAYMVRIHQSYPLYGWIRNMGYPTPEHYDALAVHGPTPHHRRTFRLF